MRIILVNTRHYFGGGDSTDCFNLAELLRAKGHSVAFFAMSSKANLPDPNEDLFVSHIDFRAISHRMHPANCYRVLSRVIYFKEARDKFEKLIDRFRPDIVHLHNIHGHISPSVIFAAKKRGLPVVWRLHDYKLICPNSHYLVDATEEICEACGQGRYFQAIFKRCKKNSFLASAMAAGEAYLHQLMGICSKVDFFLPPSIFLKRMFLRQGFPAKKIIQLPYLLSDEMFHGKDSDQGYFLFLGKLEPKKGIFPLLHAARLVPDSRLILAGPVNEPLASQLPGLLPGNTTYVGLKNRQEVRELLLGARALILPSVWYENQPFAILEAFAAGKPVITSDLGGMAELVEDGDRGLLTPSGDAVALSGAMQWMANNPKRAKIMGARARDYAKATHSPDRHYEKLMEVYGHLFSLEN